MSRPVCCLVGGGGLLGRHLVPVLLDSGREVIVLDSHPTTADFPDVEYRVGHYGDENIIAPVLGRCTEIVDLAYASHHKMSIDDPVSELIDNVPPAVSLFERISSGHHLRKILFVSSGGTVYGPTRHSPIPETTPTDPISPHGITCLAIEKYAFMFQRTRGLPALVARPGNAYGPGQLPFTGQGFIATAIGSVLRGLPVPVFGGGITVRDYLYVEDLAQGILALLERGQIGESYNLGAGHGLSNMQVLELLEPVARLRGHELRLDHQAARGFDVPISVLDITKITQTTGWRPHVPFEVGLARTWDAIATTLSSTSVG